MAAGWLGPHLAFFSPRSTRQLISRRTTSLQCCIVDPAAAKAEIAPAPGATPGREVGAEGRVTFGRRRLLGSSCRRGSPAPAPSSSPCSSSSPGRQSKLWHRRLPRPPLGNTPAHAMRSECVRSRGELQRCRAPLHPDSHRHTLAVTRTPRPAGSKSSLPPELLGAELGTASRWFLGEGRECPTGVIHHPSCSCLGKRGVLQCQLPGSGQGVPLPICPRRCRHCHKTFLPGSRRT